MMKHSEEFKQEAVRIALTSGLSRGRVAKDLGIGKSTLGKWLAQYRPADLVSAQQADLARENERLRLENRVLKEERDILKKATQFFAHGRGASRRNPAILGQVPTDRLDQLGALAHHQIAGAEHEACSLLLLGLHRNEAHAGALCCLADRLAIDRILPVPLHERLHIRRGISFPSWPSACR